jgi:replicative DNA helicase
MIDPITAFTMASAAFNTVKKFVEVGRELEDTVGQLGKWYGAVSDFRRAEQDNKNPPLFKKLFNSGSIEEEALAIMMHNKKIQEQEYELKMMLNLRYGPNTWEQMMQLRRKIAKERQETVYRQQEMRKALIDGVLTVALALIGMAIVGGMVYGVGLYKEWW